MAYKNKKAGARFEADVRTALKNCGYFLYVKGVSTPGIDIFALKDSTAVQLELKSHVRFQKAQFTEAYHQLLENKKTVDDFIDKTQYNISDTKYCLIYYIRNEKLVIVNVDGSEKVYIKKRSTNITNFLKECFVDYGLI